jgi:glycosyltransferase involved in cell wall biosynthesis
MKVIFLTHGFPREPSDAVGSFVLRLAVLLREEGVTVHVVAPAAPGLAARDTIEGITVERFRYAPESYETLAYSGTMMTQVKESPTAFAALGTFIAANAAAAFRAIGRERADVVHAHWWFPGGLAGAAATRLRRVPLVTTLHGSDIRAARAAPGAGAGFRYVMRSSAVVTAVSRWLAEEAVAIAPGPVPRVAPMPVDSTLYHPAAGERVRDRLLFVGKLNEQKGISVLLRAMATMTARPTLDIVMGPGSDDAPTRRLAEEVGVDSQIRWHATMPQPELAALYREMTALVAPMIGEGLGLIAVEAALSGLPVVAADSGGLRDIVVAGQTGLVVPPADPAALSYALDALIAMPDQGASLGAAGRARALQQFAPAAVARRYADVYQQAIAVSGKR